MLMLIGNLISGGPCATWISQPSYTSPKRSEGHRHLYRWELREEPGGCAITFSNTFGKDESRVSNSIVCGWHRMFEHLVDQLEGRTTSWDDADRERIVELYWHYRNKPR